MTNASNSSDVVVVGGGMAGLLAARDIAAAGLSVTVLEGRGRLGGRVLTQHVEGWPHPVELGAEFVHGRPPRLLELVETSGAGLASAEFTHFLKTSSGLTPLESFWSQMTELFEPAGFEQRDRSVLEVLEGASLHPDAARMMSLFVEGFHAADVQRASARSVSLQMAGSDDAQQRTSRGYAQVLSFVERAARERGARLMLSARVTAVSFRPGAVSIDTARGTFRARAALLALPLSAYKADPDAGGIRFDPDIATARRALDTMEMGHALRMVVRLREPLWDRDELASGAFVHAPELRVPTFWTSGDADAPQITAWCGGPRAAQLAELDGAELGAELVHSLAEALTVPAPRVASAILETHHHCFSRDPFSRGAYPYLLVGARLEGAFDGESRTLFFAGDYTDPTEIGTVGATVERASAAARELIASLGAG